MTRAVVAMACLALAMAAAPAGAQQIADPLLVRGLELEGDGQPRLAAPLYRRALGGADPVTALLGLERVYAELGMTDSLLVPLDSVVQRLPVDPTVRAVQLRTLRSLRQEGALRAAAEEWRRRAPRDLAPYRELARLLLADGRPRAADSVIHAAGRALGSTAALSQEIAHVRAAEGAWEASAEAWRTALGAETWLSQAATLALAPAPAAQRAGIRAAFMRAPVLPAARLALASLETRWGTASLGWDALRDLAPDSAAAEAWVTYGELSELDGRWAHARAAYEAALRWRASDALRIRAATAALAAGDAAAALALTPLPSRDVDSARVARELLPLHVMALASVGRPAEAEGVVARYGAHLPPGGRAMLAREIAMGWVRAGDLARARPALAAAGEDADSSAAAGWIALYEGDAGAARAILGRGEERSADVALALAVLARFRETRAPAVGAAFLSLARGDTAAAARDFATAAARTPAAASLLLLTSARLHVMDGDSTAALRLLDAVAADHAESTEAPEALLLAARVRLARGERAAAIAQLERLLLTYPVSSLVPIARRELELVRSAVPPSGR